MVSEEVCDSLDVEAKPEEVVSGREDGNIGSGYGQSSGGKECQQW